MKKNNSVQLLIFVFVLSLLWGCHSHVSSDLCDSGAKGASSHASECGENVVDQGVGPLGYPLFVRGGFNGWGTDNPFIYKGKGVYQSVLRAAPGNHEFKLAANDWKEEWVIADAGNKPARLDTKYSLITGGAGNFLFVRKTGYYLFTFDFSKADSPTLLITETEGPKTKTIDPHKNHNFSEVKTFKTWDGTTEKVTFSVNYPDHKYRRYAQTTTQSLRDPVPQYTRYEEKEGYPRVRSGNLQFDALFALAVDEMRLDSVENIRDGNYNNGDSIPCDCFETGEKWHYVWTRDLSYAAHLSLAMLDPQRVANSLLFKLSGYRDGIKKAANVPGTEDGLQIVQDTGTGGSWPISTDRMTWAFGAEQVMYYLPEPQRSAFMKKALKALKNTIEIDRVAVFDGRDGLYLGEQSFLDWREQTYASWITDDIASLGSSKSLSTNVGHFHALKLASHLAQELNAPVLSVKYSDWATDLKNAINKRLWLDDTGMFSSTTAPHFDEAPLHKYDWLGLSLAVITGVAEGERAQSSLNNYPHGPMGAPVIFPQQPGIPVYHNRAIWPFVTAYGLKAAAEIGNSRVADEAYRTLIRGASLNLSNMENLEWLSAQPLLLDDNTPRLSGPVINSKRQLWSVAGYLGMVTDTLFGIKTSASGVRFKPFMTSGLRSEQFAGLKSIALYDLTLRNAAVDMKIVLPEQSEEQGYYRVESVVFNGKEVRGEVAWQDFKDSNTVVVRLGRLIRDNGKLTQIQGNPYSTDDPKLFAPLEPQLTLLSEKAPAFTIEDTVNKGQVEYSLYKNGEQVSATVKGKTIQADALSSEDTQACFSLAANYAVSKTRSHHSVAHCLGDRQDIAVTDSRVISNLAVFKGASAGRGPLLENWGAPNDELNVDDIVIRRPGRYAFQMKYHNAYNEINLGISNGVKWVVLLDENNNEVAKGVLQMPHAKVIKGEKPWVYSTPLVVQLPQGKYRLEFADFTNMSYLSSNITFTGSGGLSGPSNHFDVGGIRVTRLAK